MTERRYKLPQTPFGKRLQEIRIAFGLSEGRELSGKAFAEMLGLEPSTYYRYESGLSEPNLRTLAKVQQLTGASLDYLIGGKKVL